MPDPNSINKGGLWARLFAMGPESEDAAAAAAAGLPVAVPVAPAEANASEDARKRKLAEARNKSSSLVYQTEKLLKEHSDKLDPVAKSAVESAIQKVKEKEKSEDADAIEQAVEELNTAAQALSKHMYEQGAKGQPGGEGAPGGTGGSTSNDDVIDAEFEKK